MATASAGGAATEFGQLREKALLAAQQDNWDEAVRAWSEVRIRFPQHPAGYVGTGAALRGAGRHDEAEILLADAAERFADNAQIAFERAWLCNARGDWPEAMRQWEKVTRRWPGELQGHLGALTTLRAMGQLDQSAAQIEPARTALSQAKRAGIDNLALRRLEFAIAQASDDWHAVRHAAERVIAAEARPSAHTLMALATACWHLKDHDGAEQAAVSALAADPNEGHAAYILAWVAGERGDAQQALAYYRRLSQIAPQNPRWTLEIVRVLYLSGKIDEAMDELTQARRRWPDDPAIDAWLLNHGLEHLRMDGQASGRPKNKGVAWIERELQEIVEAAPTDGELKRPLVADDPRQDVVIAAAAGAATTVMVFTGTHDHLTMPIALFDRHLAAFGVSAVYLKDHRRLMYLKGIRSLGDYEQTVAALRELQSRLGGKRLLTLGVREGGYAAVRYGVELGADRIISFEAVTGKSQARSGGSKPFLNMISMPVLSAIPEGQRDLRSFLVRRPNHSAVEFVYGEQMTMAQAHAERLSDLPGVSLRPLAGIKKQVLRTLARRPDFRDTLHGLLQLSESGLR